MPAAINHTVNAANASIPPNNHHSRAPPPLVVRFNFPRSAVVIKMQGYQSFFYENLWIYCLIYGNHVFCICTDILFEYKVIESKHLCKTF